MRRQEMVLRCLAEYVDRNAREDPEGVAVVFGEERIGNWELKRRVDMLAGALRETGVQPGDRVAMLCSSRPEFWELFLACTRVGATWLGLNPRYRLNELTYIVENSQPKLLFGLLSWGGRNYADDLRALKAAVDTVDLLVTVGGECDDAVPFAAFAARGSVGTPPGSEVGPRPSDPALIVYTSGTTGRPKGVVLSHYALCSGATMQTRHIDLDHPRMIVNFPINHVAAVADSCAPTLIKGGTIVFQDDFEPSAFLSAIRKERCNILGGVPTALQLLMDHPDFTASNLESVELIAWGGAALPRELIARLAETGARLMTVYGMTETAANITYTREGASVDELAESIGVPDEACECRVVAPDGSACDVDEEGELQFKADFLMSEYWRNVPATDAVFTDDDWLRTGDVGFWRKDGNLQLIGRMSDMYKSGGFNVYPREVELTLEELPEIALAAVVPVADKLYQQVGHAFVLAAPGQQISETKLIEHCRARLANYKIPKRILVCNALPLLPVGKVDKRALALKYAVGPHEAAVGVDPVQYA